MGKMLRSLTAVALFSLATVAIAQSTSSQAASDPCSPAWKGEKAQKESIAQRLKDGITTVPCAHIGSGGCLTDTPQAPSVDRRLSGGVPLTDTPCPKETAYQSTSQTQSVPDAPTPQPQTIKPAPAAQPAAQPDPSDPTSRPDWKPNPDDDVQKKSMGQRVKDQVTAPVCINGHCVGGSKPKAKDQDEAGPGPSQKPPRSDEQNKSLNDDGESSSRSTIGDISPPKDDARNHPESTTGMEKATDDVAEMKKWDPHKAGKNVEVGDYYFNQKNYVAARSRYEEALDWKDNYADAMFKLAVADEKIWGEMAKDVRRNPLLAESPSNYRDEARKYYHLYLKTLPDGEHAQEAKDAIARLDATAKK